MRHVLLVLILTSSAEIFIRAENRTSAGLARSVVRSLQNAPLTAFAAADPDRRGQFVAALYVPEQLLVIVAAHPDVSAIEARITPTLNVRKRVSPARGSERSCQF